VVPFNSFLPPQWGTFCFCVRSLGWGSILNYNYWRALWLEWGASTSRWLPVGWTHWSCRCRATPLRWSWCLRCPRWVCGILKQLIRDIFSRIQCGKIRIWTKNYHQTKLISERYSIRILHFDFNMEFFLYLQYTIRSMPSSMDYYIFYLVSNIFI